MASLVCSPTNKAAGLERSDMLAWVIRRSLDRPGLIAWVCLWFAAVGLFYVRDIPLDLTPNLAPAETTIQTEAPGLSAGQVEDLVTRPIESGIVGAAGVAQVHSQSVQGLSMITVRFAQGADPYRARQAVGENLTTLAGALPTGVSPPRLAPLTSRDAQVIQIGFTSAKLDLMTLRDIVQWNVRPRLQTVAGAAQVSIDGGRTRRIEVRARPADLSDSDLGFLDVLNAVRRATSVAGAGFIDTPSQRVAIEPHGQALTADDIAAGQIQVPGSTPVRIGDVSDVVEAPAPSFGDALIGGKPGVILTVSRQYGANALKTTHAIEAALAELKPALAGQGVEIAEIDRPASFTVAALNGLAWELSIGVLFIVVALVLFLRERRAVLVVLASIPLPLIAALVMLKALGWSLNAMTVGGLILSLGIVFDDVVIGVDNVTERLREAGHGHSHGSDRDTILAAILEVRDPVTYAIFAMIAALAPLLSLHGLQGALLLPVAVVVIVASLASLIVAVAVTPALCMLFHTHQAPLPDPAILTRLKNAHGRLLRKAGARSGALLLGAGLLAVLSFGVIGLNRSQLLPPMHDRHLVAEVMAPPGTALAAMTDYGARDGAAFRRIPGVSAVSEKIGRDTTGTEGWGPEHAVYDLDLTPELGVSAQDDVARQVRAILAFNPGFKATVASRFDSAQTGLGGTAPVQITLYGQDLDALDATAGTIARILQGLPGARDVRIESVARAPAVRVDLNFPQLALYGLSAADVMDTVQAAFAGEKVTQIYDRGRVIEVAVSAQDRLRRDPEGVGDLLLRSTSGISVPLKTVANVYLADDRSTIAHDGGLRRQVISADPIDPGRFEKEAREAIVGHITLPPGAFLDFSGTNKAVNQARRDLLVSYALAGFAIVGLLSVAFDGRTALVILGSSLLAFVGGAAGVVLFLGGVLTVGAIIGFLVTFGLSMRSAILLCDRLEHLVLDHRADWSLPTVAAAARQRLTPILMTTLLAALALGPLAFDAGLPGREIIGPMAIIVLSGLVTGTLATLVILPIMLFRFWRPGNARRGRRPRDHAHSHGAD
jgi:CzcA family heavy metal efflux pump